MNRNADDYSITIEFDDAEDEFLLNYGVNKGYKKFPSKFDRCIFISGMAKVFYHNIFHYAYGDKMSCYPSQKKLCVNLGCVSRKSITEYTSELEELGVIECYINNSTRNIHYKFKKFHQMKILYHSEMVYAILGESNIYSDDIIKQVKDYIKSDLYVEVNKSNDPTSYYDTIKDWFLSCGKSMVENEVDVTEDITIEVNNPRLNLAKKCTNINQDEVVSEPMERRKSKKRTKSDDPNVWNSSDFAFYFQSQFVKKYGFGTSSNEAELGALKRLIGLKNNNLTIKEQMDIYIENKDNVFQIISILDFSSTKTQALLDAYVINGKYPDYKVKPGQYKTSNDEYYDSLSDF